MNQSLMSFLRGGVLPLSLFLAGCSDNFVNGPDRFTGTLELMNWADTLVVGDRRPVTARVLDQQEREVLDRQLDWSVGNSNLLSLSASTTTDGDSVRIAALQPGTTNVTVHFLDPLFEESSSARPVTVVWAGVQLLTSDTLSLTAVGDTATIAAAALAHDSTGAEVPSAGQGISWAHHGAAVALVGEGNSIRVVAQQNGVDTLVASHPICLAGAACADTAIVTVALPEDPDPIDPEAGPTPGADLIVFNDINMWGTEPENLKFFENLANFTIVGVRASATKVMFYTGSTSRCGANCSTTGGIVSGLAGKLTELGYTLVDETSSLASIPADVKMVFLWTPTAEVSASDVNALKQFASEGGRVVLIGENGGYMGVGGLATENKLIGDLGGQLTNQGDCLVPGEYALAEGSHQLVAGVPQIFMNCVSPMEPGPNDFVLFRAEGGEVVGAVVKIDLTPLPVTPPDDV